MHEEATRQPSDPASGLLHLRACLREQLRAWPEPAAAVRRQIAQTALNQRAGARRWLVSPQVIGLYPPRLQAPAAPRRSSEDDARR